MKRRIVPITKSAKKALRQNKKRQKRNIGRKKSLKDIIKNIQVLISENKNEEALKLLPKAYKIIDKSAKTGLIKKNTAARKKSRMTKLINREEKNKS